MKTIKALSGKEFIVDDEDYEKVIAKGPWSVTSKNYIQKANHTTTIRLHRWLLGLKRSDKICVDHIDRNPLNNQKSNLRLCSNTQNKFNQAIQKNKVTSKYKGVFKNNKKWRAVINCNNKQMYGGLFDTEIEAAHKANELMLKYQGEFAVLNVI